MKAKPMTVSCNYREQLCVDSAPGPGTIVIFGASGDLTKRKLLPAIHALFERKLLPEKFAVIGVARTEMTNEAFQEEVREAMAANGDTVTDDFLARFSYVAGQYTEAAMFELLETELKRVSEAHGTE